MSIGPAPTPPSSEGTNKPKNPASRTASTTSSVSAPFASALAALASNRSLSSSAASRRRVCDPRFNDCRGESLVTTGSPPSIGSILFRGGLYHSSRSDRVCQGGNECAHSCADPVLAVDLVCYK